MPDPGGYTIAGNVLYREQRIYAIPITFFPSTTSILLSESTRAARRRACMPLPLAYHFPVISYFLFSNMPGPDAPKSFIAVRAG